MIPTLVVDAVATYRLTRLVTADAITAPWRDQLVRNAYVARDGEAVAVDMEAETPHDTWSDRATDDDDPPALAQLLVCRWCMGVWIAAAVTVARRSWPRQWGPVADAATLAAAAALLARLED